MAQPPLPAMKTTLGTVIKRILARVKSNTPATYVIRSDKVSPPLISVPAFVTLVTTVAALYPAMRAARVDPIIALRHE